MTGTISITRVLPNLNFAPIVYFTGVPGEARNVVLVQGGQVRVFRDDQATSTSSVVLDLALTTDFTSGGEMGMLGLALILTSLRTAQTRLANCVCLRFHSLSATTKQA